MLKLVLYTNFCFGPTIVTPKCQFIQGLAMIRCKRMQYRHNFTTFSSTRVSTPYMWITVVICLIMYSLIIKSQFVLAICSACIEHWNSMSFLQIKRERVLITFRWALWASLLWFCFSISTIVMLFANIAFINLVFIYFYLNIFCPIFEKPIFTDFVIFIFQEFFIESLACNPKCQC